MSIPFTQYLRPDGRRRPITINRPDEIEARARRVMEAGLVFEAEELRDGTVSLTVSDGEEDLFMELTQNGPPVLDAVDRLVNAAYNHISQ